jgi:FAD/FMN-containing dehydrogenase
MFAGRFVERGSADVIAGVLLANERGWQVSTRSGGHGDLVHRPSKFMADDNFAKLQRLRDIYDPDRRFFDLYAPAGATINSFEPR